MKVDYSKVADKVKFWKQVIENAKDFTGSSPPAVFVGRAFYPKVYVGILAPTTQQSNTNILDFPEKWYEQKANIEQILNYRGQLIYSRFKTSSVKRPSGKLVDVTQELAMAKKSTDVEIHLKKNPRFTFNFDGWSQPIGNPAPIDSAILTENPYVERRVDYIISDSDFKAQNAVVELYQHNLPVSRIQKIFSAGLLGLQIQRKFVPTRWSITAVDDTLGKILIEKIKDYQELSEILLFHNEYIANHFEVLLIPEPWKFEMIEAWNLNFPYPTMASDFENYWGRDSYAAQITGGYYAARIGALEYLEKIKRQATVLIVREIKPGYWADVGVWKVRETVRDAFNKPYEKFDSVGAAIKTICQRMVIKDKWKEKSRLLKTLKEQQKIINYFKKSDSL
jgi:hypothetical protein